MTLLLTTVDRVKITAGNSAYGAAGVANSTFDPVCEKHILDCSFAFERYLERGMEYKERSEIYDITPGQKVWWIKGFPSVVDLDVYYDINGQFGSETVVDPSYYRLDATNGKIEFWSNAFIPYPQALKITYTGGMAQYAGTAADATDAFLDLYGDIGAAADVHVLYCIRKFPTIGNQRMNLSGGSVTERASDFDEYVKSILDLHVRKL